LSGDIAVGRANLTITGGAVNANRLVTSASSPDYAVLTLSGGTLRLTNGLDSSINGTVPFSMTLNGGALYTPSIRAGDWEQPGLGLNIWSYLDGTIIHPTASTTNFITFYGTGQNLYLAYNSWAATFSTDGYDITVGANLLASGAGGLSKQGAGTLTLAGRNTYTGTTAVQGGVLALANQAALGEGPLTISSGAKAALNFAGQSYVTQLTLNGSVQPVGTYGSSSSSATYKNDTYFSGTGVIFAGATVNHFLLATNSMIAADPAWAASNWAGVRSALSNVINDLKLPAQWRSIPHLRYAQSYQAAGDYTNASAVFGVIAATTDYPMVHKLEGAECKAECDRLALGLPGRDPMANQVAVPTALPRGRTYYVATNGSDSNPGTLAQPFATVNKALAANRAAGPVVAGEVLIQIGNGRYALTNTISLSSADSAIGPLHLKAATPGGVMISGSKRLTGFTLVTNASILARLPAEAQGKVMQCSLAALGITDYGSIQAFGGGFFPNPVVNLYVNGVPQTLARWPNSGFVQIASLVNPGSGNWYTAGSTPQTFAYAGDRPSRWTNAPDAWLHGYFPGAAYDESVAIGSINPQAKTITTAWCVSFISGWNEMNSSSTFRAFNLLEEIDQPGEWYLDRTTGILYWYPTVDPSTAAIDISMLSTPMLTVNNLSNLRIEGLVFEASRGAGLQLNSCTNTLIAGCTVRNLGGIGVSHTGGRTNSMIGCDLHGLDQTACILDAGDRNTLAPGNSVIANCRFRDFGRVTRSAAIGVSIVGVSNRITHCVFDNCPNSAISFKGCNHLVEYNEFRNCCNETDDSGVIAAWGNPTYRGNLWRFNHFTHCGGGYTQGWVQNRYFGTEAFRFDDAISGQNVYGNIIDHQDVWGTTASGVGVNSGRDNIVDNNLMMDIKAPNSGYYNQYDDLYYWYKWNNDPPSGLTPVYLTAFPELNRLYDWQGQNYIWRSASLRCLQGGLPAYTDNPDWMRWQFLADNNSGSDTGFVDGSEIKTNLSQTLFWNLGMRAIPINEIGLYDQAARAGWLDNPANNYWNGGAGNWDNASVNWSTNNGAPASAAWNTNGYTTAVFAGAGGTVTVAAPVTADSLSFATSGYTLAGTNPVVLNNLVTMIDQKSFGATINAPLTGQGGIAVAGTATLTLGGTNNYTGTTAVRVGTLALSGGNNRLPTNTIVTLGDGGPSNHSILKLNGCNQQLGGLWAVGYDNFQYGVYAGDRIVNGSATPCTLTLNIENGNDQFVGTLGGGGANENNYSLVKNGGGKLWLAQPLNLTGSTTIAAGTLELHTEFYMGNQASGTFNIGSNATLAVSGNIDNYVFNYVAINYQSAGAGTLTVIGNGNDYLNWYLNGGMTITTAGGSQNIFSATPGYGLSLNGNNILFNVARGTDASSDLTVSAKLSNNGNITKQGNGILQLLGTNSYAGSTTVNGGTVILRNPTASTGISVAAGAMLELNITNDLDVPSLTISGAGTVRKTGAGQWVCGGGAANFALASGALLDVQAGTFIGGSSANENWTANYSDLNVAVGALFKGVEANARVNRITGSGTLGTGYSGAGYQFLSIGIGNGTSSFDGVIQNTDGNPSYVGNVVKSGTGTIALNGANTYTGTTTISNGTLLVNGYLANGTVTVSGGVLGGTGTINGPVT
ncbi:MAG: autotransporter-associated beta strand repeat-containing protein, partial [Verrucomicrobiota bacterium]